MKLWQIGALATGALAIASIGSFVYDKYREGIDEVTDEVTTEISDEDLIDV